MRLLLITNVFPSPLHPTKGVFNLELARALRRSHEVSVICPIAWTDELAGVRRGRRVPAGRADATDGIAAHFPRFYFSPKVLRRHYGSFMWHSVAGTVRRQVERFRPDAVIGYWAHPDGEVAVRAARLAGVPAVVMVGGSDVLLMTGDATRRRCVLDVLHAAGAVVPVSNSLRQKLIEFGIGPEKIHVVERGVDTSVFFPGDRDEARRRLGLDFDGPLIVWVGRMVPVKGLDVLLGACARLRDRGLRLRVCLVGDGPLRGALEQQANAAGLYELIRFVGVVDHHRLPDWYRAADAMVLPSRSEGVPNVLREASACGVPYVASKVGGIPELPDAARNRLVSPEDVGALADALGEAIGNPSKAGRVDGPRVAAPATSWEHSAQSLAHVISRLRESTLGPNGSPMFTAPPAPEGQISVSTGSPWFHRRMLRRAMQACVPRRWFLTRGPARSRSIGLTFDDGPHPQHTPRILDVLGEHGIRATFFVIGRCAAEHPHLVRRIVSEGHAIGHHSFNHVPLGRMRAGEVVEEVRQTQQVLRQSAGITSRLFRPPFGKLTAGKLLHLWRAGQTVVLWSFDPRDYACASSDQLVERMRTHRPVGGDIVLLHDSQPFTGSALGPFIRSVRDDGLDFCTLDGWAV